MILAYFIIITGTLLAALTFLKPTFFWEHAKTDYLKRLLEEKGATIFLLLVSVAFIAIGLHSITRIRTERELEEIVAAYKNGKTENAEERLVALSSAHPHYYLAWTTLGNIYLDNDNSKDAIACFNNGIKANEESYESYSGLGRAYAQRRHFTKAKEEYLKANALMPNEWSVLANLAAVYNELGDVKKAVEYGEKALLLNPDNAALCANLSIYYHKDKQFDKRDQLFEKAEDLDYEDMQSLNDAYEISNDSLKK